MKLSPAIIFGSGPLLAPLSEGIQQRLRELHPGEPWLELINALQIGATGEIIHTALTEGGRRLTGKALKDLPKDGDFRARFLALRGENLELLTHEVLAGLYHELRRTDLAMALNRQGHQLEKDFHFCFLATSFDPDSSVAALAGLLALHRLYLSGLCPERPRAQLFIFLPDLFPDHDTAPNWARTYEFIRELQALYLNARWFGEGEAKLEADFHPFLLSRSLSSGLAMPSWESYVSPLAEFIAGLVRNLMPPGATYLDFLAGKPALMNAFGYFKFFYPHREIGEYLKGLAHSELSRQFGKERGAGLETELGQDLSAWTGLAKPEQPGLDREILSAAGLAAGKGWGLPVFSPESFRRADNLETELNRDADRLANEYQRLRTEEVAARITALRAAQFQVTEKKIAELDALVHKHFAGRVRDPEGEKLSLESGPALLALFLNLPAQEDAPAQGQPSREHAAAGPVPSYCLEAWERLYLIKREELLGTPEKNHELSSLELKIQEMNDARENNLERLKQLSAQSAGLKSEREKKLAEAEGRLAEKAPATPVKTESAAVPAPTSGPAPSAATADGGSSVDKLWGAKQDPDSLVSKLWGEKKAAAPEPKRASAGKPGKGESVSPAAAAAVLLDPREEWRKPSAKEAELKGQENVILEYQERLEKELPELQAKRDKLSSEILMSRKLVLDESFSDRKILDLESEKNRDLAARKNAAGRLAAELQRERDKLTDLKTSYRVKRALFTGLGILALLITLGIAVVHFAGSQGAPLDVSVWLKTAPGSLFGTGVFFLLAVYLFAKAIGVSGRPGESEGAERKMDAGFNRLAESMREMALIYQGLLDQRYALSLNYFCLLVFSRLREHARAARDQLLEFKARLKTPGEGAPRLQVQESPWEISLAPADFSSYIGREYGAILSNRMSELCAPENLWGWFQAFVRSGQAPPLDAEMAKISDQTFAKEREEKTLGERLAERLRDERFREFLANLLANLGVSALVNEETACDSKVRKANYLALRADEETLNLLMTTIRRSTGLELTPVESDDPHNLLILMHWYNWAPFQLAQMAKARECRSQFLADGSNDGFSVLGREGAGILPDIFPVKELLAPEQLIYRELAVYGIVGGWIEADWEKCRFQAGPELRDPAMPPIFSYADFILFLGSAEGASVREFLAERMKKLLFGPREGTLPAERERTQARIERLIREYDLRRAVANVLEQDDYEILTRFPEKLI